MHRESTFITLYNHLEHSLNIICKKIGEEFNSNIRLKHLHGSGVKRALLFLNKIPEFDFSDINQTVSFIRNTNKLRNLVVHSGGSLPSSETEKVNRFIDTQPSLSGFPGETVIFREQFVPLYIKTLKDFFVHIENEMQRYMDKYRT